MLLEMAERRTELHAMRTEHERAVRALEERLAFETASREYDPEAQQLAAALKRAGGRQRRQPRGA